MSRAHPCRTGALSLALRGGRPARQRRCRHGKLPTSRGFHSPGVSGHARRRWPPTRALDESAWIRWRRAARAVSTSSCHQRVQADDASSSRCEHVARWLGRGRSFGVLRGSHSTPQVKASAVAVPRDGCGASVTPRRQASGRARLLQPAPMRGRCAPVRWTAADNHVRHGTPAEGASGGGSNPGHVSARLDRGPGRLLA